MPHSWTVYAKKTSQLEALYRPQIHKALTALYSSFLSDLKAYGIETATANLHNVLVPQDLLTTLNSIYNRAGLMGARLTYNELKASLKPEQKAGFGTNARWLDAVLSYLKTNLYNLAAKILNTTKDDILALLDKGLKAGLGIDQIVQLFKDSPVPVSRTRLIVRTEIGRAANVGHTIGAQSFPYEVNKKWIAARDHRTRHSHNLVNGHVVDEHAAFNVPVYKGDKPTGEVDKMQAPGDPDAHPSNTINCRCRVTHEAKRDSSGSLIPRQATQAVVIPLRATSAHAIPTPSIAAQAKALQDMITMEVK